MSQPEPATSAQLKKEWLRREKEALAPLGFKHLRRDTYRIQLGEDWAGEVSFHKRAAKGPALMVYFDPPGVLLDHLPTQRLMRELYELGPKDPSFVILGAGQQDVPSNETLADVARIRPTNLAEIDEAVARSARILKEEALPWMRGHANMDTLAARLSVPRPSPGLETRRLEKLAVVSYLRGEKEETRAALCILRQEHMPSGIPLIDEPRKRFCRALEARLDEI